MTSESETHEILRRLRELEEENARLRKAAKVAAPVPLVVTEGDYKGHPTLSFEGPCRRFTLGLKKLSIIKQAWPQIEAFLKKHANSQSGQELSDYDDDKI